MKTSLFQDIPESLPAEIFERLVTRKEFTLERIVSRGQATPPGEWLCQEREEWVMLVQGGASLCFEGEAAVRLEPGDYLRIPAGKSHRVEATDPGIATVWLALHYDAKKDTRPGAPETGIGRVKVIRSSRRKKTVGARLYGGTLYVYAPARLPEKEVRRMVEQFTRRFEKAALKKELNSSKGLRRVAEEINDRYFGGELIVDSIQYVTDQTSKFGCCNIQSRSIRISHAIAAMPDWVRDYVVMHELCHLKEPSHGAGFWKLVGRYPLAERARGFLLAKGIEPEGEK